MFEDSASPLPSSSIWASMNSWFTPTVLFVFLNLVIGTIVFTSTLSNQKKHHNQQQVNDPNLPKLAKSPSVLQRLKSINFYTNFRSHQETQNLSIFSNPSSDSESLFHSELAHQEQTSETQSRYFFPTTHVENFKENTETTVKAQEGRDFEPTHNEITTESKPLLDLEENETRFDDFNGEGGELKSMDEVYSQLIGNNFNSSGGIRERLPEGKMKKSASLKSDFRHFEAEEAVEARRPATVRERGNGRVADDDEEVDAKADDFINRFKQQLKLQRLDSIVKDKEVITRWSARS